MSKHNGGPAFPNIVKHVPLHERQRASEEYELIGGMTLRDYFAAAALAHFNHQDLINKDDWWIAQQCYATADALLSERDKA